jgi:hypothetical protein
LSHNKFPTRKMMMRRRRRRRRILFNEMKGHSK